MKNLNAIVVGFGHLGNFHAQKYASLAEENVRLIAVVDPEAEKLQAKAAKIDPAIKLFSSLDELFAAVKAGSIPKPDLASVATTTDFHVKVGLQLIREGVHLLVEKPIANTSREGKILVDEADKNNIVIATGHVERHRAAEAFKGIKPLFIECHRLSPFPARSTDIDVIFDLMIHDIDLLLAMVDSPLKSISASGFPVLTKVVDIANCRFEFENGCVANVTASRISMTRVRKFRVFSLDAYLSLDLATGVFEKYNKNANEPDLEKAISHQEGTLVVADALKEEVRDFIRAVRNKTRPLVSGHDGLRAIEVAEAVVKDIQNRLARMNGNA